MSCPDSFGSSDVWVSWLEIHAFCIWIYNAEFTINPSKVLYKWNVVLSYHLSIFLLLIRFGIMLTTEFQTPQCPTSDVAVRYSLPAMLKQNKCCRVSEINWCRSVLSQCGNQRSRTQTAVNKPKGGIILSFSVLHNSDYWFFDLLNKLWVNNSLASNAGGWASFYQNQCFFTPCLNRSKYNASSGVRFDTLGYITDCETMFCMCCLEFEHNSAVNAAIIFHYCYCSCSCCCCSCSIF